MGCRKPLNLLALWVFVSGAAVFGGALLLSGCRGKYSATVLIKEKNAVCIYNGLRIRKNMLMIPFKGNPSRNEMLAEVSRLLAGYPHEVVQVLDGSNIVVVRFPNETTWDVAKRRLIAEGTRTGSKIRGASVVPLVNIQSAGYTPNDPEYKPPDNWGYVDTGIDWMWNQTFGGGQEIGLVDLWFGDLNRVPDLTSNLIELKRVNSWYSDAADAVARDLAVLNGNPVFVFESNATGYWKIYSTTGNNDRFRLGDAPDNLWERYARIAAGNTNACCVFVDWGKGDEDISACLINAEGRVLKRFSVNQTTNGIQINPVVDFIKSNGGERYVIIWVDYSNRVGKIKFRLFSSNGNAISDEVTVDASQEKQGTPSVVNLGGGDFAVLYAKEDAVDPHQNGYDVWMRKFDFNGNAISDAEVVASGQGDQFIPKAAFVDEGNNKWHLLIAWQDGNLIKGFIKDESGSNHEFDAGYGWLNDVSTLKDASTNEPCFAIFYSRKDGSDWNVRCNVRSLDGSSLDDKTINQEQKGGQFGAMGARANPGAVAVWTDFRNGNADVYAIDVSVNNGSLVLDNERRVDDVNEHSIKHWHGMAVASMLGGIDNAIGTAGGDFKVRACETDGTADDLGTRIEELLEKGCKIVVCTTNLPWVGVPDKNDPLVKELLEQYAKVWKNIARLAAEKNALIIVSAGNNPALSAELSTGIPSWLREAMPVFLVVGGYNKVGNTYSAFGSGVNQQDLDLVAPGSARACIYLNKNGENGYARVGGTSIAATFATEGAALLEALYKHLTPRQLRQFLILGGKKSNKLVSNIPAMNLEKTVELIEEKNLPSSELEFSLSNEVHFFDTIKFEGEKYLSYSFYDANADKHRLFFVNKSLGEIEIGEGTAPQLLSVGSNLIVLYQLSRAVGYKVINPQSGSVIKDHIFLRDRDKIVYEGEEYVLEGGPSVLRFKKTPLGYCGLLKFRDKIRDKMFTFFIKYDFENDMLEVLGKLPKNYHNTMFPEECWDVGELGDVHIAIFEDNPSKKVWEIYYIKRSRYGEWSVEKIGESSADGFLPTSVYLKVLFEQPLVLVSKQENSSKDLIVEQYKKEGGKWISENIIRRSVSDLLYRVNCSIDKDRRIVVVYKDGNKIHTLLPGGDNKYYEHSISTESFSPIRIIQTEKYEDYANTKIVYVLGRKNEIQKILKKDY